MLHAGLPNPAACPHPSHHLEGTPMVHPQPTPHARSMRIISAALSVHSIRTLPAVLCCALLVSALQGRRSGHQLRAPLDPRLVRCLRRIHPNRGANHRVRCLQNEAIWQEGGMCCMGLRSVQRHVCVQLQVEASCRLQVRAVHADALLLDCQQVLAYLQWRQLQEACYLCKLRCAWRNLP